MTSHQSRQTTVDYIHRKALDIVHILRCCLADLLNIFPFFVVRTVGLSLAVEDLDDEVKRMGELALSEFTGSVRFPLDD